MKAEKNHVLFLFFFMQKEPLHISLAESGLWICSGIFLHTRPSERQGLIKETQQRGPPGRRTEFLCPTSSANPKMDEAPVTISQGGASPPPRRWGSSLRTAAIELSLREGWSAALHQPPRQSGAQRPLTSSLTPQPSSVPAPRLPAPSAPSGASPPPCEWLWP